MLTPAFRTTLCLAWMLATAAGLFGMARYEQAAGRVGDTPGSWPAGTPVTLDHKRAVLLLFAHPKCPCTRASIEELNRLLTHCRGDVAVHVLFYAPRNAVDDWTHTDLWRSAEAIPGVTVEADPDGEQAQRFGAETSGYVVVYDPYGGLVFHGGITAERGHVGDNPGAETIVSLLTGQSTSTPQTPVFGCGLRNPKGGVTELNSICTKR